MRYSTTVFTKNTTATTTVRRVRFRSTMWVPPCEAGVKPIPPMPVSRPECIRISVSRNAETSTWKTAKTETIAATGYQRPAVTLARVNGPQEEARARIQKLLVTGDNRLKQGVAAAKARESYEQALEIAREAGLEASVRPLVELRLADLERLERRPPGEEAPPPGAPAH